MKPVFIPLKTEFFEAFKRGEKTSEYRRYGGPWNERVCHPGRRVVISKGYGKHARLTGVIRGTRFHLTPQDIPGWAKCYGARPNDTAIEIMIELDSPPK
jgi:hypothetical protein